MSSRTGQIFLYFGLLTLLIYLVYPEGYLVDIQTSYLLKNQLHQSAEQISAFRLIVAIPIYVAFLFGLVRDLWNPFGLRDRGYFILFAPVTAAAFLWMAMSRLSYAGLLAGTLLVTVSLRFYMAAYQGLLALIGQEKLMTGRLSTLWNVLYVTPGAVGAFASGYISGHLGRFQTFSLLAALTLFVAVLGLWKPAAVFSHTYDRPQAKGSDFRGDVKRLIKHRAIYPAVLIFFLWNFAPGANTPLQFYLTNQLHASDAVYSYFNGIFAVSFIPMFFLYGYLCQKMSLSKLLWCGTAVAVPQMVPFFFIHSSSLALFMAAPMGLMGGIASAAYYDLAMRSCPPGLQGTLMMLAMGLWQLSYRGGDVLGSWIYNSNPERGFMYCVIATTVVYALILPAILLVPRELIDTADGEAAQAF